MTHGDNEHHHEAPPVGMTLLECLVRDTNQSVIDLTEKVGESIGGQNEFQASMLSRVGNIEGKLGIKGTLQKDAPNFWTRFKTEHLKMVLFVLGLLLTVVLASFGIQGCY